MIRHYLIAALRNLAANRLQSAIAIGGLALGLSAAIVAGLVIRNQFGFDSFLPLHERLYTVGTEGIVDGMPLSPALPGTAHDEAAKLIANIPEIEAIAQTSFNFYMYRHGTVRGGDFAYSADGNIFDLLRLTALHGDLKTALDRPDAIVIPLSMARRFFGADNVVGQTLLVDGVHALRVAAVVADLPDNGSNLRSAIFVSGKAAWTTLAEADASPVNQASEFTLDTQSFLRLKPGASLEAAQARMQTLGKFLMPVPPTVKVSQRLIPITQLHVLPDYSPGVLDRLAAFSAVALVILTLSSINFVNLLTARAARRSREVGVRKALGGSRGALVAQFLGEAMVQALIALILALAVVEWTLPAVNAALQTGATLTYGPYGMAAAALVAGALLVGLAAGFYPALVLSGFQPATVLRGGPLGVGEAGLVRRMLVILQFALLAVLVIGAGVLLAQYRFALTRTLERADRVLLMNVPDCRSKIADMIRGEPGVEGTACADISFFKDIEAISPFARPDGKPAMLHRVSITPGLLEMYGEKPIAGRDLLPSDWVDDERKRGGTPMNIIINQAALRDLGLASPSAAIGHVLHIVGSSAGPAVIVGVVRDFSAFALEKPVNPIAYSYENVDPSLTPVLSIKLAVRGNEAVLTAIDREWSRANEGAPFQRIFMNDWIAAQRIALLREGQAFAVCAGIALLLGCLGLFGLSVAAAERRIKEIGVRKAMGAGNGDVLALLLWQFAQPVLWANLIAWPAAFWLMNRWLSGFAYHAALPLWLFPAAGAATLAIALLTVAGQSWLAARQKPVLALRYE